MVKKFATLTILLILVNFSTYQIQSAQGAQIQLKCANSLINRHEFGPFECIEGERKNISEWQINTSQENISSWNYESEMALKLSAKPSNVCILASKNFDQCVSSQRKFILLIGDSQVMSGLNLLSFTGTKKLIIFSQISKCPPLHFGFIEDESIYESNCINSAESRIVETLYKKISAVMIISAGRYSPFDLDQYLNLLKERRIKNIIFIGPYSRSQSKTTDWILKLREDQLIKVNYSKQPLFEKYNPKSNRFNPNLFTSVAKKHKITFINPLKEFCQEECPLILNSWPVLVDTLHWSFNFSAQIYSRNYILISDWLAKA
jgi:SGNH domain (fused to AT3 domains)